MSGSHLAPSIRRCLLPLLAFAVACGGGSPTTPVGPDTTPASISVSAGGGQTARVSTGVPTLPAVTVRNAAGAALSGVCDYTVPLELTS